MPQTDLSVQSIITEAMIDMKPARCRLVLRIIHPLPCSKKDGW